MTFRRVRHSVEKNSQVRHYVEMVKQLFYNNPLNKSIYLKDAVISQHCLSEAEVKKSMAHLKEAASCSQDAPSRLVNKELQDSLSPEVRGYWSKKPQTKDVFNRNVASIYPPCQTPCHSSKFPWSGRSQQTVINSSYVIKLRKIVIASYFLQLRKHLQQFGRSKTWYGDGTFHVALQHFYQLYTLHGVVMGQLLPKKYSTGSVPTEIRRISM